MKKYVFILLLMPFLFSCDHDSDTRNTNPFIPDYSFSVTINMNLPAYSGLHSALNPVAVNIEGAGVSGLILMKISDTDYRAWEANCPNQYPSACSRLTIEGTNAKCPCDGLVYSLFTGVGGGAYTMKPYRVEILSDALRVYN
ncbi:MAG TPA: hypothetical protein VK528_10580 [Flavobacterium sp.]|nr:hypothetical protein [Flavobacterium sp.]